MMPPDPAGMKFSYYQKTVLLIAFTFIISIIAAAATELGNDEVYYWTYSQQLQWNYFDHPPMVALWIRFFTGNLSLQQYEVFIRLGSMIGCAAATLLMYQTGKALHSPKAGWLAACLYNASVYASVIAGLFILPDSPQMVFWCFSLLLIIRICKDENNWSNWLLLGVSTGLCIMSKVHGVFIWFGLGLYIIFQRGAWLRLPQLYVSLLFTLFIISPIIIWNIHNHFITYKFHSERVTVHHFSFNTDGFLREFFGQILYNNPVNVVLIIIGLVMWYKNKLLKSAPLSVYNFIALPMAAILLAVAIFRDTLPHWSGPAYVTLLPLAAICLTAKNRYPLPLVIRWSLGITLFAVIAGILLINFYPGTLGKKSDADLGAGDFTLDMSGWKEAGKAFATIYQNDVRQGIMPENAAVVCYKWFPAAHEDYYFCRPLGLQMIGLGTASDLHQYIWMNSWRKEKTNPDKAYCIIPSNEAYDVQQKYSAYYNTIDSVATIRQVRGGRIARYFYVYRLQGLKKDIPVPENILRDKQLL